MFAWTRRANAPRRPRKLKETYMKTALPPLAALLALLCTATVAAEPIDGSQPLSCLVSTGRDCLPGTSECRLLQPERNQPPIVDIDFGKKEVRSPFRTALLSVTHSRVTDESLILQGTDLLFAWSALIKKKSGAMTIAITDREGAYVIFGTCKARSPK
jgi:hypothetical protein